MARSENKLPSRQVTLTVAPGTISLLEQLVTIGQGIYGKNPSEVAKRLLEERLRDLVTKGELQQIGATLQK